MTNVRIGFLGPEGSFTHIAAGKFASRLEGGHASGLASEFAGKSHLPELVSYPRLSAVFDAISSKKCDYGVVAIENNVEGFVGETLDLLQANPDVKIIDMLWLPIAFDAVCLFDSGADINVIRGHSHALAQCHGFIEENSLTPLPALSNSAAVAELKEGQVALSPSGYPLHERDIYASFVQDYDSAKTQFVLLKNDNTPSAMQPPLLKRGEFGGEFEEGTSPNRNIYIITPQVDAPGTLLKILTILSDAKINISTLVSRPIKGEDALYSFYLTLDAPLEIAKQAVSEIETHNNTVQHLGGYYTQ